jgi:purple acid phosphatase-like protein
MLRMYWPKETSPSIINGSWKPELELAHDDLAIVRWTITNPRGDDEHYGVVHDGTDPEDLSQTAKGHIRLNRAHPETIFRVRMEGLKPQTTYYYKVTSIDSAGASDGVQSPVNQFITPDPGERIVASPPQPVPRPR